MKHFPNRFLHCEHGATAIEYSLIAALIFLACVASIKLLGDENNGLFGTANHAVSNATSHVR